MRFKFQFVLFSCLIYFISKITCEVNFHNSHVQKKIQQKLKQESHSKHIQSLKPSMCDNIKAWHPNEDRELFVISNQNTLTSIKTISPNLDNCTGAVDMIEIIWRYLFFESMHCIRVELDLGESLKRFINATNYQYYSFSYRELGKKNNYLSRQLLNESVNVLTIKHANLRPYVICVTFYKNENIYLPYTENINNNSTDISNATNSTYEILPELTCPEYYTLLQGDDYTHNIDLCVDIDTQAHFLSDLGHHGHSNSELVMVVFITVLIIILLAVITVANYIIQKPKKRLFMHNLRKMLHRKQHHHHHNNENNHDEYTALTRSSSFGTKMSSSKPQIVITDFSSANSLDQSQYLYLNYHSNNNQKSNNSLDESKESDSLLIKTQEKLVVPEKTVHHHNQNLQSILKPATHDEHSNPNIYSVTFHVGETIIEENEETEEAKLKRAEEEVEKPSVASMSHILDDKPWLCGRSQSLVGSSVTNGVNGSRSNFENDISQLNKRFNSMASSNAAESHSGDVKNGIEPSVSTVNEANKNK